MSDKALVREYDDLFCELEVLNDVHSYEKIKDELNNVCYELERRGKLTEEGVLIN
jgi:hypothetical protein